MPLIPALGSKRRGAFCKIMASLVYRVSFSTAKATQRNPVSQKQKQRQKQNKTEKGRKRKEGGDVSFIFEHVHYIGVYILCICVK